MSAAPNKEWRSACLVFAISYPELDFPRADRVIPVLIPRTYLVAGYPKSTLLVVHRRDLVEKDVHF